MNIRFWKTKRTRKEKIILGIIGLMALYALVGFLVLPPIVSNVAVKQISQQLDREASIEAIKINPFALSASVRGLLIKDKDGEPFVSWDEVYANFQLSSLFTHSLTFAEVSTTKPHVRAVMNKDGTFNFTDIVNKFSTNATPAETKKESKPMAIRIGRLHIGGFTAAIADYSPRTPFKRALGPIDITLDNFRTDRDNRNPYAFSGTTDAGETIAWSGHFYLDPLRSQGQLKLYNFTLNKYAALYEELFNFEVRDGTLALSVNYDFELNPTNRVCLVTNSSIGLRDFRLGLPGRTNDIIGLPAFSVAGASVDLQKRIARVEAVLGDGAKLFLRRDENANINVVKAASPSANAGKAPEGIVFLLHSVTNVVNELLKSTNTWTAGVNLVSLTNCAIHLEDAVNSRPALLNLSDISFEAKNISNLPGTNLDATLALRWNTNGSIKIATSASFLPPTADVRFDIDQLDLGTLDPYLEPKLNLFVLGSKVGLHGVVKLRTPENSLPQVTFDGDASLDGFRTVDGVFGEDLVKWNAIRFNGIAANLNPQSVAIKEIAVDSLYVRLAVETNKTVNLLNALRLTNTNAPATNETQVAAAKPAATSKAKPDQATNAPLPDISIGAVIITNTAFVFSDRSIKPEVNLAIRDFGGWIAGLSTRQLQHADVALGAKVDGVGPIAITGTLNPFNDVATNTLKVTFRNVDLTPVSPYAGKFAGYRISQGKLNLDLDYLIVGKKLESKNVITIDQFNFGEKVNSPDATKLPVRLAVAIMKDSDGKIVLDVPVEGRTDDPQFRVRKVVWRAVENVLLKAATSPFSLLGAMFGGGGEELGYQDFAPGTADITAEGIKRLDSLQKALTARPALRLEISGSIDPDGDREGLQRVALDREIRTRLWQRMSKEDRATNTVENLPLAPDVRADWVKRLYNEAAAAGKINAQFIAAHTNLVSLAAQVLPKTVSQEKGATRLLKGNSGPAAKKTATTGGYQTKLVPPPDATEAVLLATIPVTGEDFEKLAATRAQNVQAYLVEVEKVDAGRIFIKASNAENLRQEGSRAYLQLQ